MLDFDAQEWVRRMERLAEIVWPTITELSEERGAKQASYKDKRRRATKPLKVKTKVMVEELPKSSFASPTYAGPYSIVRCDRNGAYTLIDETGALVSNKFNRDKLKVVGFVDVEEEAFEVTKLLDHRDRQSGVGREFLVRWKGYTEAEDSWVSEDEITVLALKEYWDGVALANADDMEEDDG